MTEANECPFCGEVGSYENRAFKQAKKRRCKNDKCRVMFFKEEASKAKEIENGLQEFKDVADDLDDLDGEKLEEIKEKIG